MVYVKIKAVVEVGEKTVPKILRDLFGGRHRDEYVFEMAPPKGKGALVGATIGCLAIAQPTPISSKTRKRWSIKKGNEHEQK